MFLSIIKLLYKTFDVSFFLDFFLTKALLIVVCNVQILCFYHLHDYYMNTLQNLYVLKHICFV